MQCSYCATPVPDNATYCHHCGSLVSDAEGQKAATASMDDSSVRHMEELLREDTKGEFQIERLLGRGGMAMVYLATEIHLARKVAIKVLPPELTFGHGVERFKREAKTAAALDHPNIIPIYRIASGGKIFWYAMKYLEGRSLDQYLKGVERLELDETCRILDQVAEALEYAHEHQVIHRDIKPANVMLDARNRVVVTDFGIAKALTEGTLTASGSVIGTPFFMSPEQGMGKPVTGASDQYSVAVMAFRMLSGKVPFEGDSAIDILHKHCMMPPPPMETLRPGLPEHVYLAIRKALSKKPEERFSGVTAFVRALREPSPEITLADAATLAVGAVPSALDQVRTEVIPAQSTGEVTGPPPPQPAPKKRRRGLVVVPLVLIAAAGSVGGWWWLTQRGVNQTPAQQTEQPAQDPAAVGEDTAAALAAAVAGSLQAAGTQTQPPPEEPAAPPPPDPGRVVITNLPPAGVVLVDGEQQSGREFEIAPGEPHEIEMRMAGYQSVTLSNVVVDAGERLQIPFTGQRVQQPTQTPRPQPARPPQPGVLVILIRPSGGADVFIDDNDLGRKTRVVETLPAGRHRVRLTLPGYRTVDTLITVRSGAADTLRIRLQPGNP